MRFKTGMSMLTISLLLLASMVYWLWLPLAPSIQTEQLKSLQGNVSHGAYLARISGCIGCHTDFTSAGSLMAGGKALNTPFGEFRAPNLTTDKTHGIGDWTIEEFASAVREGISPSGKPYYPAFPYTFYQNFSDQDIADLWSAFQTVSPVSEPDPAQSITFPFSIREGLKLWRALFFSTNTNTANQTKTAVDKLDQFARGEFIVEVAGHCGACHTPRNSLGALQKGQALSGGVDAENNKVPAITSKALRENDWTEDDLAYALQTAIKHDGDVFGGSMSAVVEYSTSYMSNEDLLAVAHYLMTRPD